MSEDEFYNEVKRANKLVKDLVTQAIESHVDAYPFVLQMTYTVLKAGMNADSCGGSEPNTIASMLIILQNFIIDTDRHSLPLLLEPTE